MMGCSVATSCSRRRSLQVYPAVTIPDCASLHPGYGTTRNLDLPLDHLQLELGDRFRRVEALRAGLGSIHDGVAAVEPERVFEIVEPLVGPEEAVAVPPVARAGGRAAGAEDALIEAVELLAVLVALLPFLLRRRR